MTDLALILTNFPSAALADAAPAAWPRLPALEMLLARAQAEPLRHGWRAWLARRCGWPERAPSAALAATAFGADALAQGVSAAASSSAAGAHYWFATPLHFFAGLDTVHLHPAGLLELSEAEQQLLAADFARTFAGTPWTLRVIGQRELLLAGPPLHATAAEPEALLARAPDECMARGADAPALRRLASEIELWLYEHPLNLERTRRGALPITALWLWGGEAVAATAAVSAPISGPAPQVYGADSYAAALCRMRGSTLLPLPARIDALPALQAASRATGSAAIALLALTPAVLEHGFIGALQEFEQLWLAGAVRAVRSRRLRALHCLLGARVYRLTWRHCMRVWRARAPWWEGLS